MVHQALDPPIYREKRLPMTFEAFMALVDDHSHAEWVDGEATFSCPRPSPTSFSVDSFIVFSPTMFGFSALAPYSMPHSGCGLRDGRSYREPDLVFIGRHHTPRSDAAWLEDPVDLAVELISGESVTRECDEKMVEYAATGVPEYWLRDPRVGSQRAEFYQRSPDGSFLSIDLNADGRYHSDAIQGFWVDPNWFWQDPLPDPARLMAEIDPHAWRDPTTPSKTP